MSNNNEAMPGNPGNLGGKPSYAEVERLVKQLYALVQEIHPNGGLVLTYVASGAQNIAHLDTQTIIYQGGQGVPPAKKELESHTIEPASSIPPPEIMVQAVEKTITGGYWWANVSWSVVYRIYQMKKYPGSISQFVREVAAWPFTRPVRFDCNDDSVGKPVRSGKLARDIDKWEEDGAPSQFRILGNALLKELEARGY